MLRIGLFSALFWLPFFSDTQADEQLTIPRLIMGVYLPGINNETNESDIRISMDYWTEQLSHELNVIDEKTEFFVDMHEMSESLKNNQLDMIVAPPLSIVKHINLADLIDGYIGVRPNGKLYSLILLVKNDAAITSLADLRGKRLVMPENDELSEVFIDTQVRKIYKGGFEHFFSSIAYQKKNTRLILDLFFGKADAALVYLPAYEVMTELNPQVKSETKLLLTYPLRAKMYSFFSRKFQYKSTVLKVIKKFPGNAKGQQIMDLFKTEEVEEAKVNELEPIKALYDEYLRLNSNNNR